MNIEDFEKAKPLVDIIHSLEKIKKSHFLKNEKSSDDNDKFRFYLTEFVSVRIINRDESTGGGSCKIPTIVLNEHCDGSGAKYTLSEDEMLEYHNFMGNMMKKRLEDSKKELGELGELGESTT